VAERITVVWDRFELERYFREPNGELGRGLMDAIGAGVAERAKRKALKRTGRMASEITHEVGSDEGGLYADIISPAADPKTGFPYPRAHEGRHPRDRRPHRSLKPALDEAPEIIREL
jgi:hypothetical protein